MYVVKEYKLCINVSGVIIELDRRCTISWLLFNIVKTCISPLALCQQHHVISPNVPNVLLSAQKPLVQQRFIKNLFSPLKSNLKIKH